MDEPELITLLRLDGELPMADPVMIALTERAAELADQATVAAAVGSYQAAPKVLGARCLAPGHGPVTAADVGVLIDTAHAGLPEHVDPALVWVLDARLARLTEILADLTAGPVRKEPGGPLAAS